MADAIDFSKTQRIVLLIDLNPLLQFQNPNPNYITSILATSTVLLSFPHLSSSLFSFKLFFSSLSTLLSASTLHRILPNHPSAFLSFDSPSHTLNSLSNTLTSISPPITQQLPSNCLHTARSLLQLAHDHDWESDFENPSGKSHNNLVTVPSNLIILLSPVCRSLNSLAEFTSVDVVSSDCLRDLDCFRGRFRDCFGAVSDAFYGKDIHFCWVDVHSHVEESETNESEKETVLGFIRGEISKFGWGFCAADLIILGSALVSFGLIYPSIVVSSKLLDSFRLDKTIAGELKLEILDAGGKPLECKCCDLELLHLKVLPKPKSNVGSSKAQDLNWLKTFLGSFDDEIMKLRVTAVRKHTEFEYLEEFSSDFIFVQSAEPDKKEKVGLDRIFDDRVFELLAGGKSELFGKHIVPTLQIFLTFLYKEGYWALLLLSNSKGDSYMGILKPFTIHSAILSLVDNNRPLTQIPGGTNISQSENDPQKDVSPLGKYDHVSDGKRRKMKKHTYRKLTWISFCKAAYEFLDVDLAEIYFEYGIKTSKKLKFMKCWMKEVKNHSLPFKNISHGQCRQTGPDLNQEKDTVIDGNLAPSYQESVAPLPMHISSDQPRMQNDDNDDALVSCTETSESFFNNLPKKIQHGVESIGVDLKILAERLVNSSVYWLHKKYETMENLNQSFTMQVAEIIRLLLREPQDLKDYNPSSTSEYLVREYELQILLRLEILQSEYAGMIKGFMKMKLVKQICSLLEIIQYLVGGGFHGDLSLYDYVERTIKSRYSKNLGDVVDKIYNQMDLLPFGEENEDEAPMFNSEDSNHQSWREKNNKSASKMIKDPLSAEHESCHLFKKVNISHQGQQTEEEHARMLNEAREKRERAKRFVSVTRRMPDLQRVWAPKQSKLVKVKPESKRKKQLPVSYYSVVCETPLIGSKPSFQYTSEGGNPVSKGLFQDDR